MPNRSHTAHSALNADDEMSKLEDQIQETERHVAKALISSGEGSHDVLTLRLRALRLNMQVLAIMEQHPSMSPNNKRAIRSELDASMPEEMALLTRINATTQHYGQGAGTSTIEKESASTNTAEQNDAQVASMLSNTQASNDNRAQCCTLQYSQLATTGHAG